MPIKSPRLQLSYNAIGKRKENIVNLKRVGERVEERERRAELGPLRDNVALTMWGGDTHTHTNSINIHEIFSNTNVITITIRMCVSVCAEVTFVCQRLCLDLCVCVCCVRARWGDSIMALMKFGT